MTYKRNAGANYLYIKRPLYRYLYIGNSIVVLFNGCLYRFLFSITRPKMVATGSSKQIAKDGNKPTTTYYFKQISSDKFIHLTKHPVIPSTKQLTNANIKPLTNPNPRHLSGAGFGA